MLHGPDTCMPLSSVSASTKLNLFYSSLQSQYVYIHDALAEYILCGDTSFSLLDAHKKLAAFRKNKGGKSGYLVQFDVCSKYCKCIVTQC